MDTLKKIFPYSVSAKDTSNFIVKIILYVVVMLVGVAAVNILKEVAKLLPLTLMNIFNIVLGLASSLISLYCVAGIVILVLVFVKVLK